MLNFKNDYSVGAHPNIIRKLAETNLTFQTGYGDDEYSLQAKEIIKAELDNPYTGIYFLSGGTQTNLITISFLLRVHEAVISAKTGHIYANETGAIEATGHRVITVDTSDGKLTPELIWEVLSEYSLKPHVVKPRMVYISNSTELGTVYTKTELEQLYGFCKKNQLLLFMDGARLGNGIMAEGSNLSLAEISALTDVFYIGGTKNGALLGEAVVFNDSSLGNEFEFALKQKGALLAKGRILGIQFLELFSDNLYYRLAEHANSMAMQMAHEIQLMGFDFMATPHSNQIFPLFSDEIIHELSKECEFYVWKKMTDNQSAVRLITSWATPQQEVDALVSLLRKLTGRK